MMSPNVRAKVILARDELDILSNKISLFTDAMRISGILTSAIKEDELDEPKTLEKP